jgi:stachyose synthetase
LCAGDDFWFQDPNGDPMGAFWLQGVHMIHCSYNSLWMGQMIRPDWDMFQSDHICAKFHAGSRAICGGPIYLSDNVGSHDFDLIKKLVFPDGTIPKCIHFPLPTRDCLFKNPLFDKTTVLKIWNFNKVFSLTHFLCQTSILATNKILCIFIIDGVSVVQYILLSYTDTWSHI